MELERLARKMEKESAQRAVADQLDGAIRMLQMNIEELERLKRDLTDESLVQTLGDAEQVAEHIQSRIGSLVGQVAGNIAWRLNIRYRNILSAVKPL